MSKEASALMKDWRPSDLRRIRNLKDGNTTGSVSTQIGYTKEEIKREEGDIWEEDGKKYIIHLGIKKRYSKLSLLRDSVKIPLFCPCCNKPLSLDIDQRMYKLNKVCLDCQINFEAKLKREGKFKDYQQNIINSNYKSELIDFRNYLAGFAKTKTMVISEEGITEEWTNDQMDVDSLLESLDEQIANA